MPRSTNVEHYARIIKEKATLRNLIFSANKILATAYEAEEDADVILDQAEHAIFAIADDKVRDGFVSLRDLAQGSLDTIEKLHARKELITGVPTGFTDLDEMTSGLQPSDLIIVAARPSMGKTSLVLNMAQHVGTKTDMTVGLFSLEMSKEQLFLRMLTAEARIDAHRLRGGFLGERDWGRLAQAIGTLSEAKIFIDDTPSIGVLEMRAKCRRLTSEHGLHLVIIDYIQLMQGRGRFENRTLELASISRSLKGLAKELSVPIVVLSQLSRAPESRSDHRPQLSDLRESGALEQDADVVMFIYREDQYADKNAPPTDTQGVAELIIGKQRNGPTGVVKLAFIREFTRFENLASGQRMIRPTVARVDLAALTSNYRHIVEAVSARARRAGRGAGDHRRRQGECLRARRRAGGARARGCRRGSAGLRRHRRRRGAAGRRRPRGDPGLRRAERQRSRRPVRRPADADHLDAGRGARRAGRGGALQAALRYHLKIDTGMNRLGFRFDNLRRTLPELLASEHLELDAVYTHFATADDPESPLFDEQRRRFERALAEVEALGGRPRYRHAANSAALLRDARVWFDRVRPGLLLYGIVPPPLASTIELVAGDDARQPGRRGQGPAGRRGHGLRRAVHRRAPDDDRDRAGRLRRRPRPAAGRARGRAHPRPPRPIVGSVCMDMLMADVTGIDVSPGDEVVIIGPQGDERIDVREMAATIGSIPWEIVCRIGARIERVYQ